jgi:antitoxin component of MazEF toxin-antitoxin module
MKFTTKVQQYNATQDLFIEIPHYVLQNLSWEEGDELAWSIKGDQIILTKVKDASKSQEEPTMSDYDWYSVKEEAIKDYLNSESEGKEYKDYDQAYEEYISAKDNYKAVQHEAFLYEHSPEAQGHFHQSTKQSQDRTVPPPPNFPHFP